MFPQRPFIDPKHCKLALTNALWRLMSEVKELPLQTISIVGEDRHPLATEGDFCVVWRVRPSSQEPDAVVERVCGIGSMDVQREDQNLVCLLAKREAYGNGTMLLFEVERITVSLNDVLTWNRDIESIAKRVMEIVLPSQTV